MSPEPTTIEVIALAPRRRKTRRKLKSSTKPLSKYKKELDAVFSRYVRNRDNNTCYTCGKVSEPTKSQNGHFVPRQYLAVRWDEVNCHCQCYACNVLYNGQPSAYAARLEKEYGVGTVEMLESKRKILTRLKPDFYEYWIAHYKQLITPLTET